MHLRPETVRDHVVGVAVRIFEPIESVELGWIEDHFWHSRHAFDDVSLDIGMEIIGWEGADHESVAHEFAVTGGETSRTKDPTTFPFLHPQEVHQACRDQDPDILIAVIVDRD